jgi:hypothetical protein
MAKAASSPSCGTRCRTICRRRKSTSPPRAGVRSAGRAAKTKVCAGLQGIIEEGSDTIKQQVKGATLDAGIIAGGQRAEHYEMAAYGTLIAWAKALGHDDIAALLSDTLQEEKAADEKLTELAEAGINDAAKSAKASKSPKANAVKATTRMKKTTTRPTADGGREMAMSGKKTTQKSESRSQKSKRKAQVEEEDHMDPKNPTPDSQSPGTSQPGRRRRATTSPEKRPLTDNERRSGTEQSEQGAPVQSGRRPGR